MSRRIIPLITNQIYHIINRGLSEQPIFSAKKDYHRFIDLMFYYQNINPPLKYSLFLKLAVKQRIAWINQLTNNNNYNCDIISYCLMPSHFHLLITQSKNNGIIKFLGNLQNSYSRYYNIKYQRRGPLYQGRFKAVRIDTEEQLLHVTRYIHLNPYSSYLIKNIEDIITYPYSSFREYLSPNPSKSINTKLILSNFKSVESYKNFIFDQAEYQRELQIIKHLILE